MRYKNMKVLSEKSVKASILIDNLEQKENLIVSFYKIG